MSAPTAWRHGHITEQDARPTFILVGGVPGAGKSTLLLGINRPSAHTLDPDRYRNALARWLPAVPYRSYRLLVHVLHALSTFSWLTLGPVRPAPHTLLVHNPATRTARRDLIGRFARRCGWRTVLLLVDVDREDALAGQHRRGRVINAESFQRHWQRWTNDREQLTAAARGQDQLPDWDEVFVVDRASAASTLGGLLH